MATVAADPGRVRAAAQPAARAARPRLPIEHSLLLTATLCLLAGGAVMVYSASSPSAIDGGTAGGMSSLVRFVLYGAVGLVVLRYASRVSLDRVRRLTGPLLGLAFALLVAVRLPGVGQSRSSARPPACWSPPSPTSARRS